MWQRLACAVESYVYVTMLPAVSVQIMMNTIAVREVSPGIYSCATQ